MLTKLYTFSVSFPQCFRSSVHEGTRGRMDVHPGAPYNQRINHLGVISRVSLDHGTAAKVPLANLSLEAAPGAYSPNLRGLKVGVTLGVAQ